MIDIIEREEDNDNEIIEAIVLNNDSAIIAKEQVEKERQVRAMEIRQWAESKRIINGIPDKRGLTRVWARLRKGYKLARAVKGICSLTTWSKWRIQYPEIAAMEEQCREERIARLQEEMLEIADNPDRDKMGQTTRDRLRIDVRQQEIDRLDRLTEIRNEQTKQKGFTAVPIQINVKYGKEDKEDDK